MTWKPEIAAAASPNFGPFFGDQAFVSPPAAASWGTLGDMSNTDISDIASGVRFRLLKSRSWPNCAVWTRPAPSPPWTCRMNIAMISTLNDAGSHGFAVCFVSPNGTFHEFNKAYNTGNQQTYPYGIDTINYNYMNSTISRAGGWALQTTGDDFVNFPAHWFELFNPGGAGALVVRMGKTLQSMMVRGLLAANSMDPNGIDRVGIQLRNDHSPIQANPCGAILQSFEWV